MLIICFLISSVDCNSESEETMQDTLSRNCKLLSIIISSFTELVSIQYIQHEKWWDINCPYHVYAFILLAIPMPVFATQNDGDVEDTNQDFAQEICKLQCNFSPLTPKVRLLILPSSW